MRRRRVLLAIDLSGFGRRILAGALDVARARGWDACVAPWGDAASDLRSALREPAAGWAGAIALARDAATAAALESARVPAVNVSAFLRTPRLAQVVGDNAAAGRAAASHLLERGHRRLAFVASARTWFAEERGRGFAEAAARAGAGCAVFRPARPLAPPAYRRAVAGWLRRQLRPLGILAENDFLARQVAAGCALAGVPIPEEVALVGVDDDELLCAATEPPLSSVAQDGEGIGRAAAELLGRLMRGARVGAGPLLVPPGPLVARRSSDAFAVGDALVADALRLLHARRGRDTTPTGLAIALRCSRRTIERRFAAAIGRSPAAEARRLRLAHARELLDGGDGLEGIARRAGFRSAKRLAEAFIAAYGCPPGRWRTRRPGLGPTA